MENFSTRQNFTLGKIAMNCDRYPESETPVMIKKIHFHPFVKILTDFHRIFQNINEQSLFNIFPDRFHNKYLLKHFYWHIIVILLLHLINHKSSLYFVNKQSNTKTHSKIIKRNKNCYLFSLANGYIEGTELDGFLREFVSSANATDVDPEAVTDAMLAELKSCFMEAYDDNQDGKIDIREVNVESFTKNDYVRVYEQI